MSVRLGVGAKTVTTLMLGGGIGVSANMLTLVWGRGVWSRNSRKMTEMINKLIKKRVNVYICFSK